MMSNMFNQAENKNPVIKSLLISLVMNVGVPLLILYLLTKYTGLSELMALIIASLVPIVTGIVELVHNRRLDLVAVLFLLGVLTNIIAIFLGGDARILIIRESFYTGALGLFCFVSLLLMPRPLMFYVGRQMMVGNDPVRISTYNAGWQQPRVRAVHRLITTVWGCALLGEFIVRVIIALTLPLFVAYGLGTTIFVLTMTSTFAWTFAYIRRVRRGGELVPQQS
ncbi:VC0807 family protein [Dictyobacter aurantiacus]|uniref:Uncharacterized protein n=1 Tax=Dictyobacter aurantiacus TaxID=1936993 RepID=A0A401ZNW3_9CHLR|nr:VC0807 family protein [Dictyobacter aurantiacus]GCE08484.1 hypothetical protein KDAU_58130 [Dictyobacter aurantiacus]